MANVMLSAMHMVGLDDVPQFGDSTGEVLAGVSRVPTEDVGDASRRRLEYGGGPDGAAAGVASGVATAAARAAEAPVAAAAMRDDVAEVRALMSRGADVNAAQGDGMTALHWAAERGNAELTTLLLQSGARAVGDDAARQLHAAPSRRPARPRRRRAGADRGRAPTCRPPTTTGATPLHLAAAVGQPRDRSRRCSPAAPRRRPRAAWGQTPLMFAAAAGRTEAVKALLAARRRPARCRQGRRHQRAQSQPTAPRAAPATQRVAALQRERAAALAKISGSAAPPPQPRGAPRRSTTATSPNRSATPTWSARTAA